METLRGWRSCYWTSYNEDPKVTYDLFKGERTVGILSITWRASCGKEPWECLGCEGERWIQIPRTPLGQRNLSIFSQGFVVRRNFARPKPQDSMFEFIWARESRSRFLEVLLKWEGDGSKDTWCRALGLEGHDPEVWIGLIRFMDSSDSVLDLWEEKHVYCSLRHTLILKSNMWPVLREFLGRETNLKNSVIE